MTCFRLFHSVIHVFQHITNIVAAAGAKSSNCASAWVDYITLNVQVHRIVHWRGKDKGCQSESVDAEAEELSQQAAAKDRPEDGRMKCIGDVRRVGKL